MRLLVHKEARMMTGEHGFSINKGGDPQEPLMLVPDNGAWRVIMCQPGLVVTVSPAGATPLPRLWLPGQQQ